MRWLNEDQPPELHWNRSSLESAGACDVARLKQRLGAVIKAKCALDNKERREQKKQQKDERREAAGIRRGTPGSRESLAPRLPLGLETLA